MPTRYLMHILFIFPTTGVNADSIAMRVRQLYQNDLPSMYQRGLCPVGDLQQRSTATPTPTPSPTTTPSPTNIPSPTPTAAGFVCNSCVLLTILMLLLSILMLLN